MSSGKQQVSKENIMKRLPSAVLVITLFLFPSSSFIKGRGGGPYVFFSFSNLEPANDYVVGYGFPSLGDSLVCFGGGGSRRTGRIELGGFGGSGESTSFNGANEAKLGISFGAFRLDYYLKETDNLSFLASGGFGGIRAKLRLEGDNSARFKISSFLFYGGLTLRYKLAERLSLELGADYDYAPDKNWERQAGSLPEPEPLDLSGATIRLGVRFGW